MWCGCKNSIRRTVVILVLMGICVSAGIVSAEGMAWREKPMSMNIKVESMDKANTILGFDVKQGECFRVELYAAGGTGYEWKLVSSDLQLVEMLAQTVEPQSNLSGGKVCTTFVLMAKEGVTGKETVDFSLRRSWEPAENAAKNISCAVTIRE